MNHFTVTNRCSRRLPGATGVNQESVVSAVGTSLANYLALAATTEPGDEILIEQPTYELITDTARSWGWRSSVFHGRGKEL